MSTLSCKRSAGRGGCGLHGGSEADGRPSRVTVEKTSGREGWVSCYRFFLPKSLNKHVSIGYSCSELSSFYLLEEFITPFDLLLWRMLRSTRIESNSSITSLV